MRRLASPAFLFFSLTVSGSAFAQSAEDVKRAAAAFDQGRSAYRAESYGEAAENFEAADGFAPSAKALRLAFVARKAAGQLDRAATLAALAVDKYPEDEATMTDAKEILDEASSSLGRVEASCDTSGDLLLDGKLVHGKCDGTRVLFVTPGDHKLTASWSKARTVTKQVSVAAGASESLNFVAPPEPVEAPPEPTPSSTSGGGAATESTSGGWSPVVFWTGLGVTAAGAGVSTFLGIRAQNEPGVERVKEECSDTTCELYKQGVANQNMATIAWSATAAVGAFTIVSAFLTDWGGKKSDEPAAFETGRVTWTPTLGFGDGATLGARGSF